jgi:hypothetical protein
MWALLIILAVLWAFVAGHQFGSYFLAVQVNSYERNRRKNLTYLALAALGWPLVALAYAGTLAYIKLTEPA